MKIEISNISLSKKGFFSAFAFFAAFSALKAELPSSPLDYEYTMTGSETIIYYNSYEIAAGGVLNVSGDGVMLLVQYNSNNFSRLRGQGTVNVGSDDAGGIFTVTSTSSFTEDNWTNIVNFDGAINVGKMGQATFSGDFPSHYGSVFKVGTLDVKGAVSVLSSAPDNNSYFSVKNLAVHEGGEFASDICLLSLDGGVWDLYSGGLSTSRVRVGAGTLTINLRGENAAANIGRIALDSGNGSDLKLNVYADNSIERLEFVSNGSVELLVADGATLFISSVGTKDDGSGMTGMELVFRDWRDGAVVFGDSGLFVEDNRLYISSDSYVDLTAYDGEGNLLQGEWFYDWNGETGRLGLNAVPEPAAVSAVLGALALVLAARRARKK